MIVIGNLLIALGGVLDLLLGAIFFLVIGRAIISWVNADPSNPIVRFLVLSTEPFIRPIRKVVPILGGGIDLSPLILIAVIYFLRAFLVQTLVDYGAHLKIAMLTT